MDLDLRKVPINATLVSGVVYIIAFNYLPDSIRTAYAGLNGTAFTVLAIAGIFGAKRGGERTMLLGLSMIVTAWVMGAVLDPDNSYREIASVGAGVRATVPFFTGIAIIAHRDKLSLRLMFVATAAIVLFAAVIAATSPMEPLNGIPRLHPFTGGAGSFHPSAYVISLCVCVMYELTRSRNILRPLVLALLGIAVIITLGIRVRTSWVILMALFGFEVFLRLLPRLPETGAVNLRSSRGVIMILTLLVGVCLLALYLIAFTDFRELAAFSSDRLPNYIERFEVIGARDVVPFFFGTGPGSDLFRTTIWWWKAHDSHNDYIHILVEGGLVAFGGLFVYLRGLYRATGSTGLPYIAALAFSSAVSNALIDRPYEIVLFYLALGLRLAIKDAADVPIRAQSALPRGGPLQNSQSA
jgi:hypothetical protein